MYHSTLASGEIRRQIDSDWYISDACWADVVFERMSQEGMLPRNMLLLYLFMLSDHMRILTPLERDLETEGRDLPFRVDFHSRYDRIF